MPKKLPLPIRPIMNRLAKWRGLELQRIPPDGFDRSLHRTVSPGFPDRPIIFDVGANIGMSAKRYLEEFPEAQIFCFEPVAATFAELERNTCAIASIRRIRAAVSDKNSEVDIEIGIKSEENRVADIRAPAAYIERVPSLTLDEFVRSSGIPHVDILKTDTEGHDLQVLYGASQILRQCVRVVLCEVGLQRDNVCHTAFPQVYDFMRSLSFGLEGMYGILYRGNGTVKYANALFVRCEEPSN